MPAVVTGKSDVPIPGGSPANRNFRRSALDSVVVSGLPAILVIPGTMTAATINVAKL